MVERVFSVADGATDQAMIAKSVAATVREIVSESEAASRAFDEVSEASADAEQRASYGAEIAEAPLPDPCRFALSA
jgi:hypothetical protein